MSQTQISPSILSPGGPTWGTFGTLSAVAVKTGNLSASIINTPQTNSTVLSSLSTFNNQIIFADLSTQASAGIGSPVQTWQNMGSSRAQGVTYTNSTGRPIQVAINGLQAGPDSIYFYINGNQIQAVYVTNQGSAWVISNAIIPNGATYKLSTGQQGITWWELR